MSRVSYQVQLDRHEVAAPAFAPLAADAIHTRKRDGKVRISVELSKRQARWLRDASTGTDPDAVLRALVDLGMELRIDWASATKASAVRDAVRDSVLIRHAL